jgi:hypothetical protein
LLFLKYHLIGTIKVLCPLNVGFTADILRGQGAGGSGFKPTFSIFWRLLLRGKMGDAIKLLTEERITKLHPGTWLLFIFMILYQVVIYCLTVVGLSRRRIPGVTLFLFLVIAYFILIPGVVGEARFRVPIEPLFALLAAAGMLRGVDVKR